MLVARLKLKLNNGYELTVAQLIRQESVRKRVRS
jgi:hypothetical protein